MALKRRKFETVLGQGCMLIYEKMNAQRFAG